MDGTLEHLKEDLQTPNPHRPLRIHLIVTSLSNDPSHHPQTHLDYRDNRDRVRKPCIRLGTEGGWDDTPSDTLNEAGPMDHLETRGLLR